MLLLTSKSPSICSACGLSSFVMKARNGAKEQNACLGKLYSHKHILLRSAIVLLLHAGVKVSLFNKFKTEGATLLGWLFLLAHMLEWKCDYSHLPDTQRQAQQIYRVHMYPGKFWTVMYTIATLQTTELHIPQRTHWHSQHSEQSSIVVKWP